jgi:uncharacterized protein YndB with AHSA1/START domain
MAMYRFVTHWQFDAPIDRVWDVLNTPARYPDWWPSIVEYHDLKPGVTGLGASAERVVRGRLPYRLRYRTVVTCFDPPRELGYDATGDLTGEGRFVLAEQEGKTEVVFYWDVRTSGFWLNLLAPLLKWLFAWNHNWVMAQGERGLAQWLKQHAAA